MRDETLCLHAGYTPGNTEPRVVPIVQSTTYTYDTTADVAAVFDEPTKSLIYSRFANPTVMAIEAKIAELEGGVGAMCTTSGQAASLMSILNICQAGESIVASAQIYGGTINLLSYTFKKLGIECIFVDPDASYEEICAAIKPNTKAVFGETIANPALSVLDIEKFAKAAHDNNIPLIVDNTFATPINCRPFEFGADIVTHSTTKYLDGHGAQVGGAIVDSGNFNWADYPDKYPGLCTPDDSYHGVIYTERFGKGAYITKATAQLMRDFGSTPSPQSAFILNLGIESLHVRVPRHCENALAVAKFLKNHPNVTWVRYPSLEGDKYYELAKKYMPGGSCGVVSFGVKGGRAAAEAFMKRLKVAAIETHVADARTCCLHPASATHRQMNDAELEACGVSADLVRYSCGIENKDDLIADLDAALRG